MRHCQKFVFPIPWNDLTNGVRVHLIDGDGVPEKPETRQVVCHKKNPALGKKPVWYAKTVLIEQDDAQQMKDEEEVPTPTFKPG